ncbi:MAG: RdgB/HAM1 family non-canonical purine NTP pyrophosphatase [Geodermatophilaceae bacterium]|nr:RdgB/HAM1 family non-canonical purine NTP pyrophosphatase [Geodermatophilaceae bacterium]
MTGQTLVLATRNLQKLAELRRILEPAVEVDVLGLDDLPPFEEAPETGATFADNALGKARDAATVTGLPAIADDSGLAVEALNGMPGVLSARWSGRHGDDTANLELLLGQLLDIPDERRRAAFVCAAAFVLPSGLEHVLEAEMSGTIVREARGVGGFGYDPIFVPDGYSVTTAELAPETKDAISHRGKAFRALVPVITAALGH